MQRSRTIREGTLGLFALLGLIVFGILTLWIRGGGFGSKGYQFLVKFADVGGLQLGAPVNYRGVTVGKLTKLEASSEEVIATLEITSENLHIPKDSTVGTSRSGLVGEAAIDITPPKTPLPENISSLSPVASDCDENSGIICNNERVEGKTGTQVLDSVNKLAEAYSDPKFVNNINNVTKSAAITVEKVGKLTDDISLTLKLTQRDVARLSGQLSNTSQSFTKTADNASRLLANTDSVIVNNQQKIQQTLDETAQLTANLNGLLDENRGQIANTLENFNQTSMELSRLAANMNAVVLKVNNTIDAVDTPVLAQDLKTLVANANATMANLQQISQTLNDPTTLLTIQQTLDAARATLENTNKITADVDEVLGDPKFRSNLKKLVDGLSQLVSVNQQLEQQIQAAQSLNVLAKSDPTPRLNNPRPLNPQVHITPQGQNILE